MFRLSRVWKLYFFYTCVLLVSIIIGSLILQARLKITLRDHLQDDALVVASVLAAMIPETESSKVLDAWCRKYRDIANVRITLVGLDGKVIGESNRESIQIENHLDRPEVKEALDSGVGKAIRYSDTLRIDMFYIAKLLKVKNLIIRVAMPMRYVQAIENQVMLFLTLVLYLTPVVAMIFSFLFAKYLTSENRKATEAEW